jgi:hypothetical protein
VLGPVAAVAAASPFSALTVGPPAPGWTSTMTLYDDPAGLVAGVQSALRGCELRVAASTVGLGWSGRLWSVGLACVACFGVVPDLSALRWRATAGRVELLLPGTVRPSSPQLAATGVDADDAVADELFHEVVEQHLAPLFDALSRWVAPGALWGNAASSLAAAGRLLPLDLGDRLPAEVLAAGDATVRSLLARPPLAGRLTPAGRRRSCCLFYRIPGGGLCNDCSLDAVPLSGRLP